MVSKIALEEHFLFLDFIEYWSPTVVDLPTQRRDKALSRLTDFGEMRLTAMNEAGIARAVLALAGPGVRPNATRRPQCVEPVRPTIFWPERSTNGRIVIRASATSPCRMPAPRPTNSSAAYAS